MSASRWIRLRESFMQSSPGWRVTVVGTTVATVILGGMQIDNTISSDRARAAQRAAKAEAILEVLGSPPLRGTIGACDERVDWEIGTTFGEPGASSFPTRQDYVRALDVPGSSEVPCQPTSLDATYTTTIGDMVVNVTIADVLPYTKGELPSGNYRLPIPVTPSFSPSVTD